MTEPREKHRAEIIAEWIVAEFADDPLITLAQACSIVIARAAAHDATEAEALPVARAFAADIESLTKAVCRT